MNDLVSVKTSCIFLLIRGRVIKTKQNFWWNENFLRVEKPTSGGSEGLIGLKWINELWWKHILDCSVPLKGWPSTPHETIESAAQNSTRFWKNVFDCWYRTHSICCQSKKKKKKKNGISRPWSDARRRWFNASNHYSEDPWIQPWGLFWILSTNVWRTVKKKVKMVFFYYLEKRFVAAFSLSVVLIDTLESSNQLLNKSVFKRTLMDSSVCRFSSVICGSLTWGEGTDVERQSNEDLIHHSPHAGLQRQFNLFSLQHFENRWLRLF